MTAADIPAAMRLKEAAGWNQTEMDWHNLLRLAPEGCFCMHADGAIAATTTAVCFGRELAWIGMVLTHPDFRGRGLARALMEHALATLEGRVDWIKLDATDMGHPLYSKLGFEDESPIERWAARVPAVGEAEKLPPAAPDLDLDRRAFGADRSGLLSILNAIESVGTEGGYAMGRAGSKAHYFGPCVAANPQAARRLVQGFLSRHPGETVYWDLLPQNERAVRLAQEQGFEPLRRLVRMARPGKAPLAHDDRQVYAIAGFEYG
jgi:GNAT superfamily N-acetyltransferase